MKKKILVLGVCTLLVCGCGKTIPKLENGSDAVVTFENGNMISINDLYNDLKDNYALNSLINLIDKKILEDKYKDSITSANEYADNTMKSLKDNYGTELESMIKMYSGYQSIDAYRDYLYISQLQDKAIEEYAKNQITEKEMKSYYEKNIYGDVLLNHILITSKASSDASQDDKNKAQDEAKAKVNKIIEELKKSNNVKETFTKLAKEQSEDASTKDEGGSLGYVNNGTLSNAYDEIIKNAFKLKNGEYSTEVITTELGYHVIFREDSKEKAKFEDVQDSIRTTLSTNMIKEDTTVAAKALQELRKSYGMNITDSEIQSQYALYMQNALTPKKTTTN